MKRYWNYKTRTCYIDKQLDYLPTEVKENLIEIEEEYWKYLVRQHNLEGKRLGVDEQTKLPIVEEEVSSSEEISHEDIS